MIVLQIFAILILLKSYQVGGGFYLITKTAIAVDQNSLRYDYHEFKTALFHKKIILCRWSFQL